MASVSRVSDQVGFNVFCLSLRNARKLDRCRVSSMKPPGLSQPPDTAGARLPSPGSERPAKLPQSVTNSGRPGSGPHAPQASDTRSTSEIIAAYLQNSDDSDETDLLAIVQPRGGSEEFRASLALLALVTGSALMIDGGWTAS
jgi:hypothetical protein